MSTKLPNSMPLPSRGKAGIPQLSTNQSFVDFMARGWEPAHLPKPIELRSYSRRKPSGKAVANVPWPGNCRIRRTRAGPCK